MELLPFDGASVWAFVSAAASLVGAALTGAALAVSEFLSAMAYCISLRLDCASCAVRVAASA